MGLIGEAKEIAQVLQKAGNIELYGKMLQIQSDALELQEENDRLRRENVELKTQLELKASMTFRAPYWYQEGDTVPHCPNCWEGSRKAMHLVGDPTVSVRCPQCDFRYVVPSDEPFEFPASTFRDTIQF